MTWEDLQLCAITELSLLELGIVICPVENGSKEKFFVAACYTSTAINFQMFSLICISSASVSELSNATSAGSVLGYPVDENQTQLNVRFDSFLFLHILLG